MATAIKKRDLITYMVRAQTFQAIARTIHRDGTVTVETQFQLDIDGGYLTGYVGHRYRMNSSDLVLL